MNEPAIAASDEPPAFETLRYATTERVAVITYDRQERRNAWGLQMYRDVVAAVERANADPGIGAIVITHDGPVFCAGTDFKDGPHPRDPDTGARPTMAAQAMAADDSWLHLMARSKPVIGAVEGQAIGLGVTQLLAMDIRVAGKDAVFSFPFVAVGFMPELGGSALLPQIVGYGRAVDLCLTAGSVDATEALSIGLITRLAAPGEALSTAIELGQKIAQFGPLQLRLTKSLLVNNAAESDLGAALERERDAFAELFRARRASRSDKSPKQK